MTKIGIIGAGQLGQMLGYAAKKLNIECIFLDPNLNSPAKSAGEVLNYEFSDLEGIKKLSSMVDVITYEFENVPVEAIDALGSKFVFPGARALEIAQDRLKEKKLFESLGIPVAKYKVINSFDDLQNTASEINYPFILKTRRFGYDGKGQITINSPNDIAIAWSQLKDHQLIAEQMIMFDYEVSAIGARNISGNIASYPLTQNKHKEGILRTSITKNDNQKLVDDAYKFHTKILTELDYVGVLALELFVVKGKLIANEFAPRVHNSGHWTIEGAHSSQFENHLRAILDLKLGDTSNLGFVGMENLIGAIPNGLKSLNPKEYFVHDYGKAPRPKRKLGHVTVIATTQEERLEKLQKIRVILENKDLN
ncbi:MAG: 5-(carboxyamino)imidazole ribonucleotide synthase [Woeseiaceae bacterium]